MSESSGAYNSIGTNATRKNNAVKGRGVDWDLSRRNREDKTVQVRKQKRIDRVNIERRKFKLNEDSSSDVTGGQQQQGTSRLHQGRSLLSHSQNMMNFTVLPRKCEMLLSEKLEDQLDAAMFFRRILAADRNPPLDLVVQSSVVIPRLIEFLSRYDSPSLQMEVAWSITNIACGEARHIGALVMSGVMLQLMLLVQATPQRKVRDQAMWAICNLTADADACRSALLIPTFLPTILAQVGLYCDAAVPTYADIIDSMMIIGDNSLQQRSDDYPTPPSRIIQVQMKENPTLSAMRYVSLTCSNFARLKDKDFPVEISAGQQHEVFRTVLFCMSEMVQSPDDEIVVEICNTLISLLPERIELVDVVLEYGLVSRMFEMVVASNLHANGVMFELALVVLCVILRSPNPLHRSAVLSGRSTAAAQCYCYSKRSPTATATASGSRYAAHETTLLSYIMQYLGRGTCVNAATEIDLVRGLSVIVEEVPRYVVDSAHVSIVAGLLRGVNGSSHDLKVEVGQFLCRLILVSQVDPMQQLGRLDAPTVLLLASCWATFLTTSDSLLLFNSLRSLSLIFQYAVQQPSAAYSFEVLHCGQLKDQAASLAFHPVREISAAAAHLEDCILSYMHSSDDW